MNPHLIERAFSEIEFSSKLIITALKAKREKTKDMSVGFRGWLEYLEDDSLSVALESQLK